MGTRLATIISSGGARPKWVASLSLTTGSAFVRVTFRRDNRHITELRLSERMASALTSIGTVTMDRWPTSAGGDMADTSEVTFGIDWPRDFPFDDYSAEVEYQKGLAEQIRGILTTALRPPRDANPEPGYRAMTLPARFPARDAARPKMTPAQIRIARRENRQMLRTLRRHG